MADESTTLLTPEIRSVIGKESVPIHGTIERRHLRQFATAIRWPDPPNPVYVDEEFARQTRWGAPYAPPTMFFSVCRAETKEEREGGHDIPLKGKAGLNMGVEWEFLKPIRLGDTLTSITRITDLQEKPMSAGGKMVLTLRESVYKNQQGETVVVARLTTGRTFPDAK